MKTMYIIIGGKEMKATIAVLGDTAVSKVRQLQASKSRYLMLTMLAGMYIGFGIILIFTIGGLLSPTGFAGTKIIMGISFGIGLSLVLMAGADLFTSNTMTMTIGTLTKKTTWYETTQIWLFSYMGNFVGSIIVAALFFYSGLASGSTGEFINTAAATKMHTPFGELLFRGILCNILVCLAAWCTYKLKDETAKLIIIFLCLFAFITSGFEHSVANMTLLTISMMIPHPETVSFVGMAANLIPVTIGNIIGGALFVGGAYWYGIGEGKKSSL